jgi:hypothetical protein
MSFFSKVRSALTLVFSFLSKNTKALTEAAVIAQTITGNAALIPLTTAVGTAVQAGATSLADGIDIESLTEAAIIAQKATGNDELISTTKSVANVVSKLINN